MKGREKVWCAVRGEMRKSCFRIDRRGGQSARKAIAIEESRSFELSLFVRFLKCTFLSRLAVWFRYVRKMESGNSLSCSQKQLLQKCQ